MTCNKLNIVMHVLKKLTITVCAENTMPMHQDINKTPPAQTKIATLFSAYLCFSLTGIISVSMGRKAAHASIIHTLNWSDHFCMNQRSVNITSFRDDNGNHGRLQLTQAFKIGTGIQGEVLRNYGLFKEFYVNSTF